jgi:hypothetical protein
MVMSEAGVGIEMIVLAIANINLSDRPTDRPTERG